MVKGTVSVPPDSGSPAGTVVYLEGVLGSTKRHDATIKLENESFVPRVVAVTPGSEVKFINEDSVIHNPFSIGGSNRFDLGVLKSGVSKRAKLESAGIVTVGCLVHAKMRAYVIVVPNDYFARPGENGMFQISGIPPGRYKIRAWHEGLEPVETWVNLEEVSLQPLDIELKK